MRDYRFCLTITFRSDHFSSVARATHALAGLVRRALRGWAHNISHVQVDINLSERR